MWNSVRLFTFGFCLIGLFYLAQVIGTASSVPSRPAQAPDEAHHFALVVFFLENRLVEFDRAKVTTDRKRFNHLAHPPFYYYILAKAANFVFPALGPDYFSNNPAEYNAQAAFWVKPFRYLSILLFSPLYLFGAYLCLRRLIQEAVLTTPTALILLVLWSFLSSRLLVAAEVSDDAMALAVWPWLLYAIIGAFFPRGNLRDYFLFTVAAISGALMAKLTLLPLAGITAATALYGAVRMTVEAQTDAGSWWRKVYTRGQEIVAQIGVMALLIGIVLLAIPLASMAIDYARYGSITPMPYEVYPGMDAKTFAYNKHLLEHPLTIWQLGVEILDRMWRSTVGVYGHRFYYVTGSGPINGMTYFLWTVLLGGVAVIAFIVGRFDRREVWLLIAISSLTFAIFMIVFILQNYKLHLSRGHFMAQGRYSIGYLEMSLLATVSFGAVLMREGARRSSFWHWATTSAVYLAILLLAILLARPWGLTTYYLFLASQDGSADSIFRQRGVLGSAMAIKGRGVSVRLIGTKGGRLGGYLDEAAVVLRSPGRSFEVSISVPTVPGEGAGLTTHGNKLIVSADRPVAITANSSVESVVINPYTLALVPVELEGDEKAGSPRTVKLQVSLHEDLIEELRDEARPTISVFIYGMTAGAGAESAAKRKPAPTTQ